MGTYAVDVELAVGADIKESAGGVVGTRDKRVAVGEELNGVDVGLVAGKRLDGLAGADIPELGERIAGTRDECVLVGGVEADAHDVAEVVGKLGDALARLNVPLDAGHVAGRGEDAAVVDEAAAGEVAGVARELAGDAGGAVALLVEVVYGADVVEATAGDKVARGGVGAGHDPRGAEGDGVDLVGGVGVPDDELAVLRGRDEVPAIGRPVHGINLGEMALEGALGLHQLVLGDGIVGLLGNGTNYGRSAWALAWGIKSPEGVDGNGGSCCVAGSVGSSGWKQAMQSRDGHAANDHQPAVRGIGVRARRGTYE